MRTLQLSVNGLQLIKSFEGLVLKAYKAVSTEIYYTIGYGHYGIDVKEDQTINEQEAEALLLKDVQRFVNAVNSLVKVKLNQNQFDALVSLCYNIGSGAFQRSTLLELLNKKDYFGASKQFDVWVKSGGVTLKGLIRRRSQEKELFLSPVKDEEEKKPYYVVIPNLAFWQAKALVNEYEKKGFHCEGVSVIHYRSNEKPKEHDPYLFYIHTNLASAKQLVIELKHKGYSKTFGRSR